MSLFASIFNNVMGQSGNELKTDQEDAVKGMGNIQTLSGNNVEPQNETVRECRDSLEWKFIDFTKAERSPIFDVDPCILKKFIGHTVTVLSISRKEFHGCCLAIDPVSLSVILANRVTGGKIRVITVPGYYLAKIRIDPKSVAAENTVSVNDLDVAELYHAPSLYSESKSNTLLESESNSSERVRECQESQLAPVTVTLQNENNGNSPQEGARSEYIPNDEVLKLRKESLHKLLMKHRMPVTVKEDILEIPGVQIKPPYVIESCVTNNQMIKKKLSELFKSLDSVVT